MSKQKPEIKNINGNNVNDYTDLQIKQWLNGRTVVVPKQCSRATLERLVSKELNKKSPTRGSVTFAYVNTPDGKVLQKQVPVKSPRVNRRKSAGPSDAQRRSPAPNRRKSAGPSLISASSGSKLAIKDLNAENCAEYSDLQVKQWLNRKSIVIPRTADRPMLDRLVGKQLDSDSSAPLRSSVSYAYVDTPNGKVLKRQSILVKSPGTSPRQSILVKSPGTSPRKSSVKSSPVKSPAKPERRSSGVSTRSPRTPSRVAPIVPQSSEDLNNMTVTQLKSFLTDHDVVLPAQNQRKQYYVGEAQAILRNQNRSKSPEADNSARSSSSSVFSKRKVDDHRESTSPIRKKSKTQPWTPNFESLDFDDSTKTEMSDEESENEEDVTFRVDPIGSGSSFVTPSPSSSAVNTSVDSVMTEPDQSIHERFELETPFKKTVPLLANTPLSYEPSWKKPFTSTFASLKGILSPQREPDEKNSFVYSDYASDPEEAPISPLQEAPPVTVLSRYVPKKSQVASTSSYLPPPTLPEIQPLRPSVPSSPLRQSPRRSPTRPLNRFSSSSRPSESTAPGRRSPRRSLSKPLTTFQPIGPSLSTASTTSPRLRPTAPTNSTKSSHRRVSFQEDYPEIRNDERYDSDEPLSDHLLDEIDRELNDDSLRLRHRSRVEQHRDDDEVDYYDDDDEEYSEDQEEFADDVAPPHRAYTRDSSRRSSFWKFRPVYLVIFAIALGFGMYKMKQNSVVFCDTYSTSLVNHKEMESCFPCPSNALCRDGALHCDPLFELTTDGLACQEHKSVPNLARKLVKAAVDLLARRNGDHECGYQVSTHLLSHELKGALKEDLTLSEDELEIFDLSFKKLHDIALKASESTLQFGLQRYYVRDKTLSLKCQLGLWASDHPLRVFIASVIGLIVLYVLLRRSWLLRSDRLVKRLIEQAASEILNFHGQEVSDLLLKQLLFPGGDDQTWSRVRHALVTDQRLLTTPKRVAGVDQLYFTWIAPIPQSFAEQQSVQNPMMSPFPQNQPLNSSMNSLDDSRYGMPLTPSSRNQSFQSNLSQSSNPNLDLSFHVPQNSAGNPSGQNFGANQYGPPQQGGNNPDLQIGYAPQQQSVSYPSIRRLDTPKQQRQRGENYEHQLGRNSAVERQSAFQHDERQAIPPESSERKNSGRCVVS